MKVLRIFLEFLVVVLLTVTSYFWFDVPVAVYFQHLVASHALLHKYTSHIPDLLFPFVLAVTVFCWTARFLGLSEGSRSGWFLQLCGISVPLAYAAKSVLQSAFGRPDPRVWLSHPQLSGFHWLQCCIDYRSFPSGHMTVIAALATVLWQAYPRYRAVYVCGTALLGLALVATNYHYVSDAIAGAYLGISVSRACSYALTAIHGSVRRPKPELSVHD